jgi:hypothetical protein
LGLSQAISSVVKLPEYGLLSTYLLGGAKGNIEMSVYSRDHGKIIIIIIIIH